MGIDIQEVDTRSAPDSLLKEMHGYYVGLIAEDLPDDPPVPFERMAADWRNVLETEAVPRWILRIDEEIMAVGVVFLDLEQNLENGFLRIHTRPDQRGRGFARALAEPMAERLSSHGRVRVATSCTDGHPTERLLDRLGLKRAYREKRSRLVMTEVDMDLMKLWIERAGERASDYDILFPDSPLSDDILEKYCDLQYQMNTAPRENLEEDDLIMTPERWRDIEAKAMTSFKQIQTCIAIHRPTGTFVGSTSIQTDQLQEDQAWQWETVVDPDHRNQGIGRWIKAAMIVRIAQRFPRVARVDTWNAGSNEPMLNINIAMGYRPILVTNTWQGDLETARRAFGV